MFPPGHPLANHTGSVAAFPPQAVRQLQSQLTRTAPAPPNFDSARRTPLSNFAKAPTRTAPSPTLSTLASQRLGLLPPSVLPADTRIVRNPTKNSLALPSARHFLRHPTLRLQWESTASLALAMPRLLQTGRSAHAAQRSQNGAASWRSAPAAQRTRADLVNVNVCPTHRCQPNATYHVPESEPPLHL